MLINDRAENRTEPTVRGTISPAPHNTAYPAGAQGTWLSRPHSTDVWRSVSQSRLLYTLRGRDQPVNGPEITYTDNISAHGACVVSNRPWQTGEAVQVTSLKDKIPMLGKVVYCQKLADERYRIGLNFNSSSVTRSTFRAYSGT